MFRKKFEDLAALDIQQLIADQTAESAEFELKSIRAPADAVAAGIPPLPSNWFDKNKAKWGAEIVAFANTYGGTLVVGIREKNSRADAPDWVPNCEAHATSLAQVLREKIDPPIPGMRCGGISMNEAGDGVIVVSVPASLAGPHWWKSASDAFVCHARSNTETRVASMREIHEMVLGVERSHEVVRRLRSEGFERCNDFHDTAFMYEDDPEPHQSIMIAVVAVPYHPIRIPDIHRRLEGCAVPNSLNAPVTGARQELHLALNMGREPVWPWEWRPRLQGTRWSSNTDEFVFYHDVDQLGSVSSAAVVRKAYDDRDIEPMTVVTSDPFFTALGATLARVEHVRRMASAGDRAYLLSVEVTKYGNWRLDFGPSPGYLHSKEVTAFPDYEVNSLATFNTVVKQAAIDLAHFGGLRFEPETSIDFDGLLSKMAPT